MTEASKRKEREMAARLEAAHKRGPQAEVTKTPAPFPGSATTRPGRSLREKYSSMKTNPGWDRKGLPTGDLD